MIAGGGYLEHDMCTIAGETGRFLKLLILIRVLHMSKHTKNIYTLTIRMF